jgi:hypothetical protein
MQFIQGQGLETVLQEVRRLRGGQAVTPGPDDTVSARAARGLLSGQFSAAADAPPAASSPGAGRAVEPGPPSELSSMPRKAVRRPRSAAAAWFGPVGETRG